MLKIAFIELYSSAIYGNQRNLLLTTAKLSELDGFNTIVILSDGTGDLARALQKQGVAVLACDPFGMYRRLQRWGRTTSLRIVLDTHQAERQDTMKTALHPLLISCHHVTGWSLGESNR